MEDEKKKREQVAGADEEQEERVKTDDGDVSLIEKTLAVDDDEDPLAHEIFPAGEELALTFAEDLYPGATQYFGLRH